MISPQKQKKITSLSFSQQHILKDDQNKHYRQFRSHEQKIHDQDQKAMKQKASLNKMLSIIIEEHNKFNQTKNKSFQWQLMLIDQKRTMMGIKVRLRCKFIPTQLYVVIRLSFTLQYLKDGGKVEEGTVFIQLDQVNFDISKIDKRNFQSELEKVMKPLLSKGMYNDDEDDNKWVKQLFYAVQTIFIVNQYQKKSKKTAQSLNRKQILTKYMLYHPPVTFSWSPKGFFCLTQNKVPANRGSFIGNPFSFKVSIDVPKVAHLNTVNQQQLSEANQQQISLFNWDISEQMQLFVMNKHKKQLTPYYKDNLRNSKQTESKKKLANSHNANNQKDALMSSSLKNDTVILQYVSKLTPTMRKIYERYFLPKNDFQYQLMVRSQKLNVYSVLGQNKRYQDQMLYLMEKVNIQKYKHIIQIVLGNMFANYPTFLSISQTSGGSSSHLDHVKYFVISQFFKEERVKLIGSPFNPFSCLKAIIVENQYHAQRLESYFKECFKMLGVYNASSKYQIYYLGSYLHFDEYKSEKILMKLLEEYEYHYELNLKSEKQVRLLIQSKFLQRIKKHIKIKKIVKFPPFSEDWLISEDIRKQFIEIVLPILIIRDRNYEDFYYRQLQRIISSNQKIIKFFKNLANIIKKVQQQSHTFIKHLIDEYGKYQKQKKRNEQINDVRRQFTIYCQKCQKPNRTFQIGQAQKLKICTKCQQLGNKK